MLFSLVETPDVNQIMNSLIPFGSGINYQNQVLTGDPKCAALFSGGWNAVENDTATEFPDEGFLLGTGNATALYGQNGTQESFDFDTPGDPDIAMNATMESFDACTVSFEFQCENSNDGYLRISYAFASDEYKEQVEDNTGYVDKFALLLNNENIALVPGTNDTAVTVYSINHLVNSELFIYNNPRINYSPYPDFEPDGFTKLLHAEGTIATGWNTMKIGIVDIQDNHIDSWVFIKQGSFQCVPDLDVGDDGPLPPLPGDDDGLPPLPVDDDGLPPLPIDDGLPPDTEGGDDDTLVGDDDTTVGDDDSNKPDKLPDGGGGGGKFIYDACKEISPPTN